MPFPEFNPHAQPHAELTSRLAQLRAELESVKADIDWMRHRTSAGLVDAIEMAEVEIVDARDTLRRRLKILHEEYWGRLMARPDHRQARLRAESPAGKEMFMAFAKADAVIKQAVWTIGAHSDHVKILREDQVQFDAINVREANARKRKLLKLVRAAQNDLDALSPEYEHIEAVIEPLAAGLHELKKREDALHLRLAKAKSLAKDLDSENSWERALAHEESQNLFGDRSPSRVAGRSATELGSVQRDWRKLCQRIDSLVRRATLEISDLVIDGNNFCYQDKKFHGLSPLLAALPLLAQAYAVRIVFDSSIRRRLGKNDQAIAAELGDAANVHIVASRNTADETLLDLADGAGAYVLSNDRFAEFSEKSAVREQRWIRHEIVAGRVLIHDLGINVSFVQAA